MMTDRSHRRRLKPLGCNLILAAALFAGAGLGSARQEDGSPLALGTVRRLHSEVLGEDRILSVRVPPGYEQSRISHPVLYLLYGDQTEGYFAETVSTLERLEGGAEIPAFIVVGIHNTDRYGDLLPARAPGQPVGADAFLNFLEKELFPFVESEYRTKPFRLLVGPQAGGPFGLYALARRPALFNAMVLENPFSAPASREILRAGLREYAAAKPETKRSVFINFFDRTGFQDHSEANKALAEALDTFEPVRPAALRIWRRHLEEPTFVPALELKEPLRMIFEGFYPSDAATLDGLSKILAYYKGKSEAYGFDVEPPAFFLAIEADDLSRAGRGTAAREILEYGLARHPADLNFILRLGNMALEAGELDRAEAYFKKAQEIRPDPFFASRLEAIQRMRRGSAAYFLSEALKEGLPAAKARLADLEKSQDPQVYFDERELNALGYRLLGQGRPERAVFILELNAQRHPDSWNAHDSLGEAYAKAGRMKDAVQSYERSLAINPDNANARKMLETLRGAEAREFQAQIEEAARDSGIPGLVFVLRESDGRTFTGAVGMSDISNGIPMRPDSRFYIGSISQSMLAAVVLGLEEKDKLSLDEPVSDFVDFPGADAVTVEMLLDHSSGLADWTGRDLAATDNPGLPELLRTPQTPGNLIRIAAAGKPAFAPGERQEASYTNMLLLTQIIEKVEHKPASAVLEERIFKPLGMTATGYLTAGERPGSLAAGYRAEKGWGRSLPGGLTEVGWADDNLRALAEMGIVSTAEDVLRYHIGLREEQLISPESWRKMHAVRPGKINGLGYLVLDGPRGTWEGNTGHAVGHLSINLFHVEKGLYLVVMGNLGDASLPVAKFYNIRYGNRSVG